MRNKFGMNRKLAQAQVFVPSDDGSRQRRWREFLIQEDPKEQPIRRADWVVGDETFQKRLQGYQGRAVQRRRGRPPKRRGQAADISS